MDIDSAIILANENSGQLSSDKNSFSPSMAMIEEKPFLEYHFHHLIRFGVKRVFLATGENKDKIYNYFGNRYKSLNINYIDDKSSGNTGYALKHGFASIDREHFFILHASSLFCVDLHDLSEFYFAYKPDICLTLKRKRNFFRYGSVEMDVCKVIGFEENKPQTSGMIDGRVYLTNQYLFNNYELEEYFSFEKDFLHKYCKELNICAMRSGEEFIDARVAADLQKAQRELVSLTAGD